MMVKAPGSTFSCVDASLSVEQSSRLVQNNYKRTEKTVFQVKLP
jgi:hypothetical protein